jgi:hypothetical protein
MAKVAVPEGYTPEDVERALQLLEQTRKRRETMRERQNRPEVKERMKERNRKRMIEISLLVSKARAAGIVVHPEEVEEVYRSKYSG